MTASRRYLLISPCRNEESFMRRTLDSVAGQTVLPALWVVVDDGSTDQTPAILAEYAQKLPYLRVVRRADRGVRAVGPGVVDAFYAGLEGLNVDDYDYICKLDMDLDLPLDYFERLMVRMEANPRLGTTSGKPWFTHPTTGQLTPEFIGDEVSVGASKFFRVACFKEIGGFVRQVMWDGIDCHRVRMFGWVPESVPEEALRFLHLRPMGSSQGRGILTGRIRTGFGQYFMGSAPLFVLASAVYRLFERPVILGSLAILWGYVSSVYKRVPRYDDLEFRRFMRHYQYLSLVHGKAAAARRVIAERESTWVGRHGQASNPARSA